MVKIKKLVRTNYGSTVSQAKIIKIVPKIIAIVPKVAQFAIVFDDVMLLDKQYDFFRQKNMEAAGLSTSALQARKAALDDMRPTIGIIAVKLEPIIGKDKSLLKLSGLLMHDESLKKVVVLAPLKFKRDTLSLDLSNKTIKISYFRVTGALHYEFEFCYSNKKEKKMTVKSKSLEVEITDLNMAFRIYLRGRAVFANDVVGPWSDEILI